MNKLTLKDLAAYRPYGSFKFIPVIMTSIISIHITLLLSSAFQVCLKSIPTFRKFQGGSLSNIKLI